MPRSETNGPRSWASLELTVLGFGKVHLSLRSVGLLVQVAITGALWVDPLQGQRNGVTVCEI